ncbi:MULTISPECIES: hypothetical protein [unclassified Streptomyces]|uniref:hypothetical protein n=1 Tax=unclassified Streptomyces TaxID=2593676 RepID=UPI000A8ADE5A|nr:MULTISPECIES: hypothetical protein [unclassified Streptomyces]
MSAVHTVARGTPCRCLDPGGTVPESADARFGGGFDTSGCGHPPGGADRERR